MIALVVLALSAALIQPRTTPQTDGEHAQCAAAGEAVYATALALESTQPEYGPVRAYAQALVQTYAPRLTGEPAFVERKTQAQQAYLNGTVAEAWDMTTACSADTAPPALPEDHANYGLGVVLGAAGSGAPTTLSYVEIYACNVVSEGAIQSLTADGSSPPILGALRQIAQRSAASMPSGARREGLNDFTTEAAQGMMMERLGQMDDAGYENVLEVCAAALGVTVQ